jgi:hypothetical protein
VKILVGGIVGAVVGLLLAYLSYLFEFAVLPPRGNFIFNYSALGAALFSIGFAFFGLILGCFVGRANSGSSSVLFLSLFFAAVVFLFFVFAPPKLQYGQNYFDWRALGEYLFSIARPFVLFPCLALITLYLLKLLFKVRALS